MISLNLSVFWKPFATTALLYSLFSPHIFAFEIPEENDCKTDLATLGRTYTRLYQRTLAVNQMYFFDFDSNAQASAELIRSLKSCIRHVIPRYVNTNIVSIYDLSGWYNVNENDPLWSIDEMLLHVGAPTNYFDFTPWRNGIVTNESYSIAPGFTLEDYGDKYLPAILDNLKISIQHDLYIKIIAYPVSKTIFQPASSPPYGDSESLLDDYGTILENLASTCQQSTASMLFDDSQGEITEEFHPVVDLSYSFYWYSEANVEEFDNYCIVTGLTAYAEGSGYAKLINASCYFPSELNVNQIDLYVTTYDKATPYACGCTLPSGWCTEIGGPSKITPSPQPTATGSYGDYSLVELNLFDGLKTTPDISSLQTQQMRCNENQSGTMFFSFNTEMLSHRYYIKTVMFWAFD